METPHKSGRELVEAYGAALTRALECGCPLGPPACRHVREADACEAMLLARWDALERMGRPEDAARLAELEMLAARGWRCRVCNWRGSDGGARTHADETGHSSFGIALNKAEWTALYDLRAKAREGMERAAEASPESKVEPSLRRFLGRG